MHWPVNEWFSYSHLAVPARSGPHNKPSAMYVVDVISSHVKLLNG
jgi:hypothetical protein